MNGKLYCTKPDGISILRLNRLQNAVNLVIFLWILDKVFFLDTMLLRSCFFVGGTILLMLLSKTLPFASSRFYAIFRRIWKTFDKDSFYTSLVLEPLGMAVVFNLPFCAGQT